MRTPRPAGGDSGPPSYLLSWELGGLLGRWAVRLQDALRRPAPSEAWLQVLRAALHRVRSKDAETAVDCELHLRRITWSRTRHVQDDAERDAQARLEERWARAARPVTRRGALHLVQQ